MTNLNVADSSIKSKVYENSNTGNIKNLQKKESTGLIPQSIIQELALSDPALLVEVTVRKVRKMQESIFTFVNFLYQQVSENHNVSNTALSTLKFYEQNLRAVKGTDDDSESFEKYLEHANNFSGTDAEKKAQKTAYVKATINFIASMLKRSYDTIANMKYNSMVSLRESRERSVNDMGMDMSDLRYLFQSITSNVKEMIGLVDNVSKTMTKISNALFSS